MTAAEFKAIRKQKGYTQETLAAKLGYSRQHIINYERGHYPITKIVALVVTLL